jgi:hypothetical protein
VNPALLGASPATRVTTKPACFSLFSRLQSAHRPVRGQGADLGWPGADTVLEAVMLSGGRSRVEAESEGRDEPCPHAATLAQKKRR